MSYNVDMSATQFHPAEGCFRQLGQIRCVGLRVDLVTNHCNCVGYGQIHHLQHAP